MLWKILSGIAALCLAVGAYFSYVNQGALRQERARNKSARENLDTAKKEGLKQIADKERKAKDLTDLEKQRDDAKGEVTKANDAIVAKQQESDTLKKNLDEITKQVAQVEDQITKAGDTEKLALQVDDLQKQMKEAEAAIANHEQQKAISEKELLVVQAEIIRVKDVEKRQKAGMVNPDFTARVAQAFPDLGFVVLNKGNVGGVFTRASLDVKRGKEVVARLTVREVEEGNSVADLIPGSLAQGQSIRSGDLVVASAKQPKMVEDQPPAPADGAAPAAAAPGGAPADGMAAPAAAVPGGDIFGGAAPMPAAGAPAAPAAGADPFGAPPPAPAPAGAAEGTPENPRKDDPFAPAGAAPAKPAAVDPFAPPAK